MVRKFEPKVTEVPGPRKLITVDIAEHSFPKLLGEGEAVSRVMLRDNGDGTYTLGSNAAVGVTRKSGVKPAIDVLTESFNSFLEVFEEYEGEIPAPVIEALDNSVDRWENYEGETMSSPID